MACYNNTTKFVMNLYYYAIVQDINDGIVTLDVLKNRCGPSGIQTMSIEMFNVIKTMDNRRIERPINLDDVDFEQFIGKDLHEHQIDGFYICKEDAIKIHKILKQLA